MSGWRRANILVVLSAMTHALLLLFNLTCFSWCVYQPSTINHVTLFYGFFVVTTDDLRYSYWSWTILYTMNKDKNYQILLLWLWYFLLYRIFFNKIFLSNRVESRLYDTTYLLYFSICLLCFGMNVDIMLFSLTEWREIFWDIVICSARTKEAK